MKYLKVYHWSEYFCQAQRILRNFKKSWIQYFTFSLHSLRFRWQLKLKSLRWNIWCVRHSVGRLLNALKSRWRAACARSMANTASFLTPSCAATAAVVWRRPWPHQSWFKAQNSCLLAMHECHNFLSCAPPNPIAPVSSLCSALYMVLSLALAIVLARDAAVAPVALLIKCLPHAVRFSCLIRLSTGVH